MTHEKMPEALRLADELRDCANLRCIPSENDLKAASYELERQHAEIERLRAEVDGLREGLTNLHADIMNLQHGKHGQAMVMAYKEGHRDARHAAAELVCALQPTKEQP